EVFRKYDEGNMLLSQAENEVLSQELDIRRLKEVLRRMRRQRVVYVDLAVPSPFALPLMVERFREKLTTEKLKDRLDRMLKEMEKEAAQAEEDRKSTRLNSSHSQISYAVSNLTLRSFPTRRSSDLSGGSRRCCEGCAASASSTSTSPCRARSRCR